MYRPASAGHCAKEAPRTIVQDSIDEKLVERAKAFLDKNSPLYGTARIELAGLKTSANAASTLALHPELRAHQNYDYLGVFISALWNECCPEKIIVYRHETPNIKYVGDSLLREKVLIITGNGGNASGWNAQGPLIITESCRPMVGFQATGLLITITPANTYSSFRGTHVTPEQYAENTELRKYIYQLIAAATEDPAAAEKKFGNGINITAKINELVGGGA